MFQRTQCRKFLKFLFQDLQLRKVFFDPKASFTHSFMLIGLFKVFLRLNVVWWWIWIGPPNHHLKRLIQLSEGNKQDGKLKVPTLTLATLQTCLCIKFFTPPPLHPRAITYFRELGSPAWESHSLTRWLIRTKAGELPRRSMFWGNVVLENHYSL